MLLRSQADELGRECPIYYLRRMMTSGERNYSSVEKTCLALVFASQKLRHYFLAHEIYLMVQDNQVKFSTFSRLMGGVAKQFWVQFCEYKDLQ